MSTIVVKNFPERLHERLKKRAEHNHRSMTKEVVHLVEAGLAAAPATPPLPTPVSLRSGRKITAQEIEAAIADRAPAPVDGRAALRAALVKQRDGSYINVLGIDDPSFFETLARIRREARLPDVEGLFDEGT